jgi:integrase
MSRTCADVIEHIGNRTDIPPRRRQDLTSAVRRVCRLRHRNPGDVLADVDNLRRELAQMSCASSGLSPGSYRNLKSLFGKALIAAGVTTVPRRSRAPLAPEWRQLLSAIEPYWRYLLVHFARYCSERGIAPSDVDNEVLSSYRRDLISSSLLHLPKQAARRVVRAWNCARATEAGRHLRELEIPYTRRKYSLSLATFPNSFREDLDSYQAHLKGDDVFGERGARPASPDTITARRYDILALASALVEAGRDPQSVRSLADLATAEAAKAALTVIWKRLGQRKTCYLHHLACLIVCLGRDQAKLPAHEPDRLRQLRRSLNPGPSGMTESNRRKLAQFYDRANVAALLRLPRRLLDEAVRRDRGGVRDALLAQTALAIAILLAAPLRIRTLVSLNGDEHILWSRSGPRAVVHLVIPAANVKNRVPLEFMLPSRVVELLDLYWERFRPRLVTAPGSWLFPGPNGHKERDGMRIQISETIHRATGLRMHPHLFRHLAAFLILRRNPGEFETVRVLLGHRSIETAIRFYCAIEQAAAFARFDEVVSAYLAEEE